MNFVCKKCGYKRALSEKYAGKTVVCPKCNSRLKIPADIPKPKIVKNSLDQFVKATAGKQSRDGLFEMQDDRHLAVNLNGRVWIKTGGMTAYRGEINFTREGLIEQGVGKFLKKAASSEGATLTRAQGSGVLYLADHGKKVNIIKLNGESIFVNGNDLLAFEPSIKWDIAMMKSVAGMLSGGLFNVKLEGKGHIAITTHHQPLTLVCDGNRAIHTDPNATVAWSGNLEPEIQADISIKTFLGRGNGESLQLRFLGRGFVVIQPYEEAYFQAG